jgi:hypothetical protein
VSTDNFRHRPTSEYETPTRLKGNLSQWTCPACGFSQHESAEECPKCGVVVSKFHERAADHHELGFSEAPRQSTSDSSEGKKWTTLVLGVIVCVFVAAIGLKWALKGTTRPQGAAAVAVQTPGQVQRFTAQNFDTAVIAASQRIPVLVEFYANT